jgi:hypothetical protein
MNDARLVQVYRRSTEGQWQTLSQGALSEPAQRLLMRLTGFTALADLLDPQAPAEQQLAWVDSLLEQGFAEPVPELETPPRSSSWGELALTLAH